MTFVPNPDVLAAFTLAAFVLILTPGPDMTLFIGETLRAGRARGFAAMFGAVSGVLIHSTLAAVGLSALLAASGLCYELKTVEEAYSTNTLLTQDALAGAPELAGKEVGQLDSARMEIPLPPGTYDVRFGPTPGAASKCARARPPRSAPPRSR